MNSTSQGAKTKESFRHFQLLGIIVGGIAPVGIFFLFAFVFGIENFHIWKSGLIAIVLLWFIVLTATLALLFSEPKHGNKKWFDVLFLSQAILCFILTCILVFNTGGAINSVFSFTCLYIPSIVGYVFGKDDWNLKGASLAMIASYFINLMFYSDLPESQLTDFIQKGSIIVLNQCNIGFWGPFSIKVMHGGIFLLQILILYKTAVKRSET